MIGERKALVSHVRFRKKETSDLVLSEAGQAARQAGSLLIK